MKKLKKVFALSTLTVFALLLSINTVFAAEGIWVSSTKYDFDGVSTTESTYNGGGNYNEPITLYVRTGSGAEVGKLNTVYNQGQMAKHTCWGQPFLNRYGSVVVSGKVIHSPYFYE